MKITVLGAKGFIGFHLSNYLESSGHIVNRVSRGASCEVWNPSVIINCAGQLSDTTKMVDDNLLYVNHWLNWSHHTKVNRFIQLGSSSETGPIEGARREDAPCNPSNMYEATKSSATQMCLGYARQYDMDICVVRPFTVYGPGDAPRKMLPTLWRAWAEDKDFTCFYGGHDWIHIVDFCSGIGAILDQSSDVTRGQIFNLGTGISTYNARVVQLFNHYIGGAGVKVNYATAAFYPYDVTDWRADTSKSFGLLGWRAKIGIEEGIKEFVNQRWFGEEELPGL